MHLQSTRYGDTAANRLVDVPGSRDWFLLGLGLTTRPGGMEPEAAVAMVTERRRSERAVDPDEGESTGGLRGGAGGTGLDFSPLA